MDHTSNAQTLGGREIVESLDREFARLYARSVALIEKAPVEFLYSCPEKNEYGPLEPGTKPTASVGEGVLRCAAVVEQTFGGVTSNLWDDPFEWTLPEYLSTPGRITEHLAEVEAIRRRAFNSFANDACLLKRVAVPSGETPPLIDLLLETLIGANHHYAQALIALKSLSGISLPGFII